MDQEGVSNRRGQITSKHDDAGGGPVPPLFFTLTRHAPVKRGAGFPGAMIKKTILEAVSLLLVALFIALLHHFLSPSGITIFKKRQAAPAATSSAAHRGGTAHGG